MKKIIDKSKISFYQNDQIIMTMDFISDEFVWMFNNSDIVTITKDMELYNLLDYLLKQDYTFADEELANYKDDNKLIWYSDCYYDLDDEYSKKSVSYLNIEKVNDEIHIWCKKPLDEIMGRKRKNYVIVFSPAGNGRYALNSNGSTLQDDFIINVYQALLSKNKIKTR